MSEHARPLTALSCNYEASKTGDALQLVFSGVFTRHVQRPSIEQVREDIKSSAATTVFIEAGNVNDWDSCFLTFLLNVHEFLQESEIALKVVSLNSGVERLLALATAVPEKKDAHSDKARGSFFYIVGEQFLLFCKAVADILSFLGEVSLAVVKLVKGRSNIRWRDALLFIDECGPSALPIVTLISMLVGLILAYIGAIQLQKFGAEMYVANLVGVAMTREMGAIMAAVIMAGRTGAAFAAQLGTMQVNEEIDALETFGFVPVSFLVIPRMLALILMLPVLTIFADVMGIVGGAFVIVNTIDISLAQYFGQTWETVTINDVAAGLIKSVVFAVLVSACGCLYGVRCGRSAAAVGVAVTSAVVSGIVCIVVADALFAVMFTAIGL